CVNTAAPSTAIWPAASLEIVVSDAWPILMAVNCGESLVPSPRFERASAAVEAPVPPFAMARSVPDQLELLMLLAVASVPSPRLARAVAPDSATQVVPLPTMIFPSVLARAEIAASPASSPNVVPLIDNPVPRPSHAVAPAESSQNKILSALGSVRD